MDTTVITIVNTLRELGYRNIRIIKIRKKWVLIKADQEIMRIAWNKREVFITVLKIMPEKAQMIWKSLTVKLKK